MALNYKKNEVKCDIGSYIHLWRGIKKSGKTTLFYDLVKEQYGDLDKGLLIAIGDEIGYQALDGLVYIETPTWSDVIEVIDDLCENRDDNQFEIIGLDTVDELVKLAKEEVKAIHRKTHNGERKEFNACLGGYGQPRDKVVELIDEQLARLRKAGYGIICIGHTKIKDVKTKSGDEYQQLTSNLSADYDGIFSNKADIVMTISVENEIDEDKHIQDTKRYMYFRTDGFVDAGGRFADMPVRVEYGAKNYIEAFEAGVKGAIQGKVSDKDIAKRKKEEVEERKAKAKEAAELASEIDEEKNVELISKIKPLFLSDETSKETKDKVKEYMKDNGVSFKAPESTQTKHFEEILQMLS